MFYVEIRAAEGGDDAKLLVNTMSGLYMKVDRKGRF